LHFTELDNGTLPLSRLLEKLWHYQWWFQSAAGAEYLQTLQRRYRVNIAPSFRLLLVARGNSKRGDQGRLIDSFVQALELPSGMRDRIWLSMVDAFRDCDRNVVDARIWVRLRHARAWMPAYRRLQKQLLSADSRKRINTQRRFVHERLAGISRQPLFPSQLDHQQRLNLPN
jgi:hypothetical protein